MDCSWRQRTANWKERDLEVGQWPRIGMRWGARRAERGFLSEMSAEPKIDQRGDSGCLEPADRQNACEDDLHKYLEIIFFDAPTIAILFYASQIRSANKINDK
jgi:hypothetical protein